MILNHNRHSILALVMASVLTTACVHAGSDNSKTAGAHGSVHWGYTGEIGPGQWGTLSPDFALCASGRQQSPIDIHEAKPQDLANIVFHYGPSKVNILNNGHTVQVNYDSGSYIKLDSVRYDLLQFHFHAPSEHAVNGQLADAEIHFVHKNVDGQLAVVGVLLEQGANNDAYQSVIANLPTEESAAQTINVAVAAAQMLPTNQATYRYSGSLTTPPCSEGVHWLVMAEPVQLSNTQLAAYTAIFMGNNRPLQALNGRQLTQDSSQ